MFLTPNIGWAVGILENISFAFCLGPSDNEVKGPQTANDKNVFKEFDFLTKV